ncbi:MAG TPA: histidine-type phosphatase [Candidatus Binatia bacterium]|nr:histidine-type phosphatase [Candidatus Binatia bacterium]
MNALRLIAFFVAAIVVCGLAPVRSAAAPSSSDLGMVVVVSRHGVRSPTHPAELNPYARQPWPAWSGQPGNLTERGALLMRQFGAYYRRVYGGMLGAAASGCPRSGSVFVWADVDQRTKATGDAIAQGLAPHCAIAVGHALGDPDPLFDPLPGVGVVNKAESKDSILGSVGGNFGGLLTAYGSAFATMEDVLGCAAPATCKRMTDVPTTVANDGDGGLAGLSGGLDMAADVGENLLLEYTDGHPDVGWGRVDHAKLLELLQLHILGKRLEHNSYAARAHSSNIMAHILQTLEEGATGHAVAGTRVPPGARFVFFSGHDTQLAEFSALLRLSWLIEGDQLNDTPPGSALVFELHRPSNGTAYVRTYFVAQTLDAMRAGQGENPVRVPVYVPGCPSLDCPFAKFTSVVKSSIDPRFVSKW